MFNREVRIGRAVCHPNLVRTFDYDRNAKVSYNGCANVSASVICMELCSKGSLLDFINATGPISEPAFI